MSTVCPLCARVLGTKQSCQSHQLVCQRPPRPPPTCPKCDRVFSRQRSLEAHQTRCQRPPPTCNKCNRAFCRQRSLDVHLTRCQPPPPTCDEPPPTCKWCDRVFDQQRSLDGHLVRCVFRKVYTPEGDETHTVVTPEMILARWRLINNQITDLKKRASDLVTEYERMVRAHPPNKNIIITNRRSPRCMVYTAKGFVERSLTEVVTESFQRSATALNQRSAEIDEHNDRVFQSPVNQETFDLLVTQSPTRQAVSTHRQMIVETCHQSR